MNPRLYRATRESAFNLSLSFVQIELLAVIRRNTEKNPPECLRVLDKDFEPSGQFGWGFHRATINVLWGKGLISKYGHTPIPTSAGLLVLQLLEQSGHLQEIGADVCQASTTVKEA